ncbi:GAF domain-containing protein [Alkalispirochaeta americana]|uniref:GAF domain-containing protein n=1 Tax=Alkalispirochaeta americana TaxID=159291 RepID=A0A1N6N713_9SPIO|nr:GAF domain-containing protein [Alkalispirochaeta americana]SIP87816.1 GAF domain-containing protein [Alkalispirochaeta americana]
MESSLSRPCSSDRVSAVLEKVLKAHQELLSESLPEGAIGEALGRVGEAAHVDRVYVFQNHTSPEGVVCTSHRFEWAASGVSREIDNETLQDLPLRESGYGRWLDLFLENKPVFGNICDFPAPERPILEEQKIKSLLILPIFAEGKLWGFVGFDDCTDQREWSATEIDLLFSLTIVLDRVFSGATLLASESATMELIAFIGRMREIHVTMFSSFSEQELAERTCARISSLVQAYRFFSTRPPAPQVEVKDLFGAIQPFFETLRDESVALGVPLPPLELEIEAFCLPLARALDLVLTVTEVLAILGRSREIDGASLTLSIALTDNHHQGELAVSARNEPPSGSSHTFAPDGMAFLMLRPLRERLRAVEAPRKCPGQVFRLIFPV